MSIPADAVKVQFKAEGHKQYCYWVWKFNNKWFWAAPGNGGNAESQEAAMAAARLWMRDGVSGRVR